jgi:hypothetical protein
MHGEKSHSGCGKTGDGFCEKCGKMWKNVEKCAKMWKNVEKCGR